MSRQYKRNYELLIDTGAVRHKITGLRIAFTITKSLRSYPNLAQIDIYNLSDKTKAFLESRLTKVTLNAGYGDQLDLIFTGRIRNTTPTKQGPDSITTIYSGDGQKDWEQSTYNKTLSPGVSVKQVVKDIISTFTDTSVGDLFGLEMPADKLRGQTLSGSSKDILDTLGEDYGFEWSIQDGTVVTVPLEDVVLPDDIILISSTTGMIGSPTVTIEGADVKTLLSPKLSPNRAIKIQSVANAVQVGNLNFVEARRTRAEGFYKIFEVVHKGDTHDNEWSSSVKGMALSGFS